MPRISYIILISLLSLTSGCSSMHKTLSTVKVGWSKADVVEAAGNPSRSFRKNSVDHWVYNYFRNDTPKAKLIRFKAGKVIAVSSMRKGQYSSSPDYEMNEYKAGLDKKRRESLSFQDIE